MRSLGRLARLVAIAASCAVLVSACGDDEAITGPTEAIVFGEGSIPDPVPGNIPIPSNAVIGTTMIDKVNNRSEFRVTVPTDITSVIQFFNVGLVNQGYIINTSDGNSAEWTMTFSDGDLRGTIFTTPQGESVTTSVISVNRS